MNLHIKAYHLNHWLLSLYALKYLQCSLTLLTRGWNYYFGVYSDLNLRPWKPLKKADNFEFKKNFLAIFFEGLPRVF